MSRLGRDKNPEAVDAGLKSMKIEGSGVLENEGPDTARKASIKQESPTTNGAMSPEVSGSKSPEESDSKISDPASSPSSEHLNKVETVKGDVTVKMEPGQAPKLARSSSQKIVPRPVRMFDHLPDKTSEATSSFSLMTDCTYSAKYLGATEHSMECDCTEEWNSTAGTNTACGEDSDCINRATKMECAPDCGCGAGCQNQRFQRKDYAKVSVILTEKKGYGLRTDSQLNPHQFIFEYVGEVINETQFRRRMRDYDEEGIKHFYFMSLSKGEFIDATKKGNLGRFCNHSCNPNCYVDKWVVGDKLRMGIFARRLIRPGEELVFNYNVDRYGADPQPCYCLEPNCTGYIGGKTQTERATKLSIDTIEALGIDDHDSWDTAVARRPRRKKAAGEDDEEYVNNVEPKALDEEGVTKVMATLLQCKEKWIAVKLLSRIQRCSEERVINRVVKMHGYQILNSSLSAWKDDHNVVLQILEILDKFPRLTRNKISDSKIDLTVESLLTCGDGRVENGAAAILKEWSTLEVGYRIPRKKRDPNGNGTPNRPERFDRRDSVREERRERSKTRSRSRSKSRSIEAPRGPAATTNNPRGGGQQRKNFYNGPRSARRNFNPLPPGWFAAVSNGNTYYYSASGQTTWTRPTVPAAQPPPPPKVVSSDKRLQDIIDSITNSATPKEKTPISATPQQPLPQVKEPDKQPAHPKEKWRSYNEDKRKKVYENTLFPHIKYVMDKFKSKLPREDLKRFGKEIAKKLVNSDFKNNRVENPTQISSKQERQVKKYVKDFFDKAVAKRRDHDRRKAEQKGKSDGGVASVPQSTEDVTSHHDRDVDDVHISDGSVDDGETIMKSSPLESDTPMAPGLKRKRQDEEDVKNKHQSIEGPGSSKRHKSESPPPPASPSSPASGAGISADDAQMRDGDNGEVSISPSEFEASSEGALPPPPPPPPPPLPPATSQDRAQSGDYVYTNGHDHENGTDHSGDPDVNVDTSLGIMHDEHPGMNKFSSDRLNLQGKV